MGLFDFFGKKTRVQNRNSSEKTADHTSSNARDAGFGFFGYAVSDIGLIRSNNEDNYILGKCINMDSSDRSESTVLPADIAGTWKYAGVFDGMGGGEVGELASRITAEIFLRSFEQLSESPDKAEVDFSVRQAFLKANNRIIDLQAAYDVYGTTGTVLCSNGIMFKIYHLGDSRAYLIRENELLQLTKDQTLAQMKMDAGMYGEDDPAAEVDKHKLVEYIGRDWTRANTRPVESSWIPIQSGDCILLCSDGLYDMCSNEEIKTVLQNKKTEADKAAALVNKACSKGGEDNITCIVVSFLECT